MTRWIWLILLAGCGGDFPPYSRIHSLSVLAIVADPPELPPAGGATRLHAEVFDPGGRAVDVRWSLCTLAPDARDPQLNPDCVAEPPDGPDLVPLGGGADLAATLPALSIAGQLPDGTGGIYAPVRADVRAGEDHVVAIYRLRIHLFGAPNRNPRLLGYSTLDDIRRGNDIDLMPVVDGVPESYVTFDIGAQMPITVTETTTFSWFATVGSFSDQRTDDNLQTTDVRGPGTTWRIAETEPPGRIHFWVVARDERGGTAMVPGLADLP